MKQKAILNKDISPQRLKDTKLHKERIICIYETKSNFEESYFATKTQRLKVTQRKNNLYIKLSET